MGEQVEYSVSPSGFLKYRVYDYTSELDDPNLLLQYLNILRVAVEKWDSIISPNTTFFNVAPNYYSYEILIDVDIKDFPVDHENQVDIYITNYSFFGVPASYGRTFPTAGKIEIDIDYLETIKGNIREGGKSSLYYLFIHGIGHLLGIGTLWQANLQSEPLIEYMEDSGNPSYYYTSTSKAFREYCQYFPSNASSYVGIPVENDVGPAYSHAEVGLSTNGIISADDRMIQGTLHKGLTTDEVMTVWSFDYMKEQYISKITIGILEDVGYVVDYNMADVAYVGEENPPSWINIDFSNYLAIGDDVNTTKALLNSILTESNKDDQGDPITYNITIYSMTFSGADSNVLGQAAWSTGEIWLNINNSGTYGLNGVSVSTNVAVLFHEILHVLGCVGIGERGAEFINDDSGEPLPTNIYKGPIGVAQYKLLLESNSIPTENMGNILPLEDDYGYGTATFHFEEDVNKYRWINGVFYNVIKNEIMTGIMNSTNFITPLTLGVLEDLGFGVDYTSADVISVNSNLIISTKPTMTYLNQHVVNDVIAGDDYSFLFNTEVDSENTNYVGLNIGKYILKLSGTNSGWMFMGFNLPISSSSSNEQEIFINANYEGTVIEFTGSTTYYSGEIEITVTGDFSETLMQDQYSNTRSFVFDRTAPRIEEISVEKGWNLIGMSDILVGKSLHLGPTYNTTTPPLVESLYGYNASTGKYTMVLLPENNYNILLEDYSSYWINSVETGKLYLLYNYTLLDNISQSVGSEVEVNVEEGWNMFGTILTKYKISSTTDTTLLNNSTILKYNRAINGYEEVNISDELLPNEGYVVVAKMQGVMKLIIS